MASFAGYFIAGILSGFPAARPLWMDAPVAYVSVAEGVNANKQVCGSFTSVIVNQLIDNYVGKEFPAYANVFYNRILIEPAAINLGNLIADQTRNIVVWNGYFNSVTLNSIIGQGTAGLVLTGDLAPPALIFNALQDRTYNLSISLSGPPTINAEYDFDFIAPTEDVSLTVTGSRIVVLPYFFSSPMRERLVYQTNLLTSRDGTEQRVQIRNKPRQQFSITTKLGINELNRGENFLYGWRTRVFALPVWSETRQASALQNDTVINVDTRFGDFRISSLAMIWQNERQFDVFEVASLTDSQLALSRGLNADYTNAEVLPVRLATLLANPTRLTDGSQGFVRANFEVRDNIIIPESTPTQTFLTEDVYTEEPLIEGRFIQDRYESRVEIIDYDTGSIQTFAPWIYNRIQRNFQLILEGLEEIWNFRRWLSRRRGRARPFYMPTFENNLRVVSEGFLTNPIVIKSDEQVTQAVDRTHVAFLTTSGTWVFRIINGISLAPDGNTTINFTTPVNIQRESVDRVSYMGLKRLNADAIEINWLSNTVARVTLPIIEIQP